MSDLDPYSVSNPYCVPDPAELERRLQAQQLSDQQKINRATADLAKDLFIRQLVRDSELAFRQAEEFFAYAEAWFASQGKK